MAMVLIGSRAVQYWCPAARQPKDWDIVCTREDVGTFYRENKECIVHLWPKEGGTKLGCHLRKRTNEIQIEFDIEDTESNRLLMSMGTSDIDLWGVTVHIPSLTTLMMIKRSHIILPRHWEKNIEDYHYLKEMCADLEVTEEDKKMFKTRRAEYQDGAEWINLNVTNEDFFGQSNWSAKRIIHHDDIHEAIKYQNVPIYDMCKKDPSKAIMDKEMFFALPLEYQLQAVREEAMAIALERGLIPMSFRGKRIHEELIAEAYGYAIRRICTTLTKGWFREFAIENYPLVKRPDKDFWADLKEKHPRAVGTEIIWDSPRSGQEHLNPWYEDSDISDKEW